MIVVFYRAISHLLDIYFILYLFYFILLNMPLTGLSQTKFCCITYNDNKGSYLSYLRHAGNTASSQVTFIQASGSL